MEFQFSPNETRNCIIETESKLRDLVDSVLRREYGLVWENNPILGWSRNKKTELENRRNDKKTKFPYQPLSTRLIDYAYIQDLKSLVFKNDSHFKSLFPSWNETMVMFDILGKLRNNIMHGQSNIMKHQQFLCLGICGELLLAVDHYKKGFSRSVQSYFCDLSFDVWEGTDIETAKKSSLEIAETWLRSVKERSIKEIETGSDDYGHFYKIYLTGGQAKVYSPVITGHAYLEGNTQATYIHFTSSNLDVIDQILRNGGHPCWAFNWTLSKELDVAGLASRIKEIKGSDPTSSSGVGSEIGSVSYYIYSYEEKLIRVDISTTNITLICEGKPNIGFFNAHNVFSPDIILSYLYGEISRKEIAELLRKAMDNP